MALTYPSEWKFSGATVEPIPGPLVQAFHQQAIQISNGGKNKQSIVETFKEEFASIAGASSAISSNYDWAISDLSRTMTEASSNAATFIDAYWTALNIIKKEGVPCPTAEIINNILSIHGCTFQIIPPNLIRRGADAIVGTEESADQGRPSPLTQYRLGEPLGHGGFGVVYRATRTTSVGEFPFALKVLDPSPFINNLEKAAKRFAREIKALLKLQHRGIVQYIDAGFDGQGRPFVVMPLVEGANIRDASEGCSPADVCALLAEVLHAVHHAHQQDVIHRDLKPSNILVRSSDRQPVVLDFGNAYLFDDLDSRTLTTAAIGTPGYMPSEVFANPSKRSAKHDVFSCGVIAYELFARRRPDLDYYQPLATISAGLAPLDSVILRAVAPEPQRYESAEEFRLAIIQAAHHIAGSDPKGPQRATTALLETSDASALNEHEIAILSSLLGDESTTLYRLQARLSQMNFTKLATIVGVERLRRLKFVQFSIVEQFTSEGTYSEEHVVITASGLDWMLNNVNRLKLQD